jgi:two-component system, LuxR family, sensor kinase FixL
MPSRPGLNRKPLTAAGCVALGYYLGAKLGFALTFHPVPVSTLWPPNAILLAGLLLTPTAWWLRIFGAVFVAHLAVQLQTGVPLGMILCWFISNCTEALIGAGLLRRIGDDQPRFDRLQDLVIFTAVAGLLAPFLSSFLDAAFVILNQWGEAGYWSVWRTRIQSNCLASLTIVPVIVLAFRHLSSRRRIARIRWLESAVGVTALVAVCWYVFLHQQPSPGVSPVRLYAPIPVLVAAAIRGGPLGASSSLLICAVIAIWGASHGQGPFLTRSAQENALALQLFLVMTWVPIMALAAVLREKTAAEQRARESEQYMSLVVDAAQLGTWDWDIAANRGVWSEATQRMYGISNPVATFEEFLAKAHPDDHQVLNAAFQDAVTGTRPVECEFRVGPIDHPRWIFTKGRTLRDESGTPVRLIGVNLDITNAKLAEMQLHEQRRELAHLGRITLVGELSVAIAHELNQPLSAILSNARTGRRVLSANPPDLTRVGEILDAIAKDDLRAASVIARVRQMLRNEPHLKEPLAINDVISEALLVARADLMFRHVFINTRLRPALPPVMGDKVQLHQVLLNLVMNASDAMQENSDSRQLTVSTTADPTGGVRVAVTDNGTGICPDQLDRIFDPFFSTKEKGVGLGLSVCRSIVTAHEGRLWAENNTDAGSTFYLWLPAASPEADLA